MQARRLILALANACWATLAAGAMPDYPDKPIRMLVPFAPGGNTDILARAVAQKMTANWGKSVVVDNRPGGSGVIAADIVVKAAPDGYTVFVASTGEVAINPSLIPKLPYNPEKDFLPVTLGTVSPLLVVVHPSSPAKTIKELIDLAKSKPRTLSYASVGTGSPQHLSGELFKILTGADVVHVPYKGGAPATTALLGNEVSFGFVGMGPVIPQVKSGRLRALAISTVKRSAVLPEIPTLQEAGLKGFDTTIWFAFFVPARTPKSVIAALNREIGRILRLPDVNERLTGLGLDVAPSTPEELTRFVKSESAKYRKIIEDSGTRLE